MLGAFTFDPPLIFAGGPFSGRAGGEASFDKFLPLSRHEETAWRTRIEGSLGIREREFNGPTRGWQTIYRDGIADARRRLRSQSTPTNRTAASVPTPSCRLVFYTHACEGAYGPPEYGGNPDGAGWLAIQFPGDVQPRGWTDEEVSGRD